MNFRDKKNNFVTGAEFSKNKGCDNIFSGIQINPSGQLLACCGLRCEYIPFLKLGKVDNQNVLQLYNHQFNDLLKIWLYTEGPLAILKKIGNEPPLGMHDCNYCLELLGNKENVEKILRITDNEIKNILFKYNVIRKTTIEYEKR